MDNPVPERERESARVVTLTVSDARQRKCRYKRMEGEWCNRTGGNSWYAIIGGRHTAGGPPPYIMCVLVLLACAGRAIRYAHAHPNGSPPPRGTTRSAAFTLPLAPSHRTLFLDDYTPTSHTFSAEKKTCFEMQCL